MTAVPATETLMLGTMVIPGEIESSLPLEHTAVVAQVTGPIASVSVTQRFGNPFDHPIDLTYLFPLPQDAAVVGFELRVGSRVVHSRVEEAEAARQAFDVARESGKRAGLVEERRPNLFSIDLANIQQGETILATMRYHERLRFDDGEYRFVFPMGLTPKYHRDPREAERTDSALATAGSPIGTVDIQVAIDAGIGLEDPKSPSHAIEVSRLDERRVSVRTAGEIIPNKDLVIRYRVAEDDVRGAAWTAKGKAASTLLLTAIPPRLDAAAEPAPREFVFVIDRSGSMTGGPMDQAKNALRACIRSLGTGDTFAILAFDDHLEWHQQRSVVVTQAAVKAADTWLSSVYARGGTEITRAVEAALDLPVDSSRQRYILFLTDGAVSSEREVLAVVRKRIGGGRMFTFGIGPSVNRALLTGMASAGKGTAEFLQVDEDLEEALIRFQDRVSYPAVQDVRVEWKGVRAWDVYPPTLPDLYHGQPLELAARVQSTGAASVVLTGKRGREDWRLEIPLPAPEDDPAVGRVWAKARTGALLDDLDAGAADTSTLRAEVISLAMEHHLMTRFTSLVAIDDETTSGGESKRVRVSTPLPEGLVMEGFLGGAPLAAAARPITGAFAIPALFRSRSAPQAMAMSAPPPPPTAPAKPSQDLANIAFEEIEDPEPVEDLKDPLRFLARTQNVSGSWGTGKLEVELTAAAILAYVRRGHTTRRGHYRRQLAKALQWLLAATGEGIAAVARAVALAEMGEAIGDDALAGVRESVVIPAPPDVVSNEEEFRALVLNRRSFTGTMPRTPGAKMWKLALV
jgi:Ca-activated chloride channel homolog